MYEHMKKDIHPANYRKVAFEDTSNKEIFLISSTVATKETTKVDGKEYPLYKVEISSASHPFYTGNDNVVDSAGRVERFKARATKTGAPAKKTSKK